MSVTDADLKAWTNLRLSVVLGMDDVSDVVDYLLSIENEKELFDFAAGMLPSEDEAAAFVAELQGRKTGAGAAGNNAAHGAPERGAARPGDAGAATQGRTVQAYQAMLSMTGVTKKERETQAARERHERNLAGAASGSKAVAVTPLYALGTVDGMVAYRKGGGDDDDLPAAATGKRKGKSAPKDAGAAAGGKKDDGLDAAPPVFVKPKATRRERAELLQAGAEHAFRAPGRHLTQWVGNGEGFNLIGNCMDCGKILSDQEGEGACLVCGSEQVYISANNAMLDGTPVDVALMTKRRRGGGEKGELDASERAALDRDTSEDAAFLSALDLRDRLIDFEKNRAARTTVIDDQSDFFDSNAHWLTDSQRADAAAAEKAFMDKLNKRRGDDPVTFSIDIAGRRIYGGPEDAQAAAGSAGEVGAGAAGAGSGGGGAGGLGRGAHGPTVDLMGPSITEDMALGAQYSKGGNMLVNSGLEGRAREIYEALAARHSGVGRVDGTAPGRRSTSVQHEAMAHLAKEIAPWRAAGGGGAGAFEAPAVRDDDLGVCDGPAATGASAGGAGSGPATGLGKRVEEHGLDMGKCMSMHQPWASLLVHGIKQVEGRSWPTRHRGRLWIAATVRPPPDEEIAAVLQQYAVLDAEREAVGGAPSRPLPAAYPTAALLGCIDIVDCVDRETLRASKGPGEEGTESEYGFVCEHPKRLAMPAPIKGAHKIWAVDPTLLARAQKQLYDLA